jgi:O-antigen ligase
VSAQAGAALPVAPRALRWDKLEQGGVVVLRLQVIVGVLVGLVYLVGVGLEIGPMRTAMVGVAVALAVLWPVAGLSTLALIMTSREPEILVPLYVHATLIGAIGVGCIFRLAANRQAIHIHPAVALFLGYAVYTALSVLPIISGHPASWAPTAGLQFIKVMSAAGLFLIAVYIFRRVPSGPFIAVALLGATLVTLLGVVVALGLPFALTFEGLLNPERGSRAVGGFGSANYFGFFAAQALLLTIAAWLAFPRYRVVLTIAMAVFVAGVVLSFSRSSYLASAIGLVIIAATRSLKLAAVLAVIAILLTVFAYPVFLEARVGTDVLDPDVIVERALSEDWRRRALLAGLQMFAREPFFGVGFGVFHQLSPEFIGASPATYSHNQFIASLTEQGLVGVMMIAGMLGTLAVAVWRSRHPLRPAALAMGVAFLMQSAFINSGPAFAMSALTWLVMAAVVSTVQPDAASQTKET